MLVSKTCKFIYVDGIYESGLISQRGCKAEFWRPKGTSLSLRGNIVAQIRGHLEASYRLFYCRSVDSSLNPARDCYWQPGGDDDMSTSRGAGTIPTKGSLVVKSEKRKTCGLLNAICTSCYPRLLVVVIDNLETLLQPL
jgi:hypothetical protein